MQDRIGFRLTREDRANILAVATAIHAGLPPSDSPWVSGVPITEAVREALRLAVDRLRERDATAQRKAEGRLIAFAERRQAKAVELAAGVGATAA